MQSGTDSSDISSAVTRLKRLSLMLPEHRQSDIGPLSYTRLMDLSVERIEIMAHSPEREEVLVASRILETAKDYQRWESEHSMLMRRVALQRRTQKQCSELLSENFELIHRKSLFAHLRRHQVYGRRREQLVRHFFSRHGYTRGMIAEHGIYLRSSASLACSSYLGTDLLLDAVFEEPLQDYEQLYAAYFDAYCDAVLTTEEGGSSQVALSLAYSLKCDLAVLRRTIMGLANRISIDDTEHLPSGTWSSLPDTISHQRSAGREIMFR